MKFRVAPAVMSKGRIMSHGWVCVPNHYNSFPSFIQRSVDGHVHTWEGTGDIASDGRRLLSSLPREPVGLIGYSYGGLVAWWVSIVAPDRIRELIILGSIPHRKHIPHRLRWVCRTIPSCMMLWWRDESVVSRLYSVCRDIPIESPKVPTKWFLGERDPYHKWDRNELPQWYHVIFVLHGGETHPTEQEWSRLQKFS